MQGHARVVIIGGGVTGCSILYHLTKLGWNDVVLLERSELTAGSTWHAAGNLFALTSPANAQRLQLYAIQLYRTLGEETEQPIGLHQNGGMTLACSDEEVLSLTIARTNGRRNGVEAEFIGLTEARERAPILDTRHVKAVLFEPTKGYVDPASVTNAFAAGARQRGAVIHRHCPVLETQQRPGGGWRVVTPAGRIDCDYIVNAAGLWAREVAALAGLRLPLMPVEHHYLVTEEIPELAALAHEIPNISASEAGFYSRPEGKGLLLGAYERQCRHWAVEGTPLDFGHELLPDDISRIEDNMQAAIRLLPCLDRSGIKRVVNGPMIFSPDLGPLLGPHPEARDYFCSCGVMTGFNQSAGIGKVLAEWLVEGEPSLDVSFWDVGRFGNWAGRDFTAARTRYFYEHRDDRVYPYEEIVAGRPVRTTPIYDRLNDAGAVFGFSNGWETPLWFVRKGEPREESYSYRRASWWHRVGEECRWVREAAGLFEISTFAKYRVRGPRAEQFLDRILANRPPPVGRAVLSPMLWPSGRILGDLTVTRLDKEDFLLLGAGTMQGPHLRWLRMQAPEGGVTIENLSDAWCGLMLAGPQARDCLAAVAQGDVGSNSLPFLSGKRMELTGAAEAIVVRISFTGELGYELYMPAMYQRGVYSALMANGCVPAPRPTGSHALMNLRLEKGFPSWGLELTADYTPLETGLARFVAFDKADFIGRESLLRGRDAGITERLTLFSISECGADCYGGEPIFLEDRAVGYTTSGGYGHSVGQSLALGYVAPHLNFPETSFSIELNGERVAARAHARPPYDPDGLKMRG